MFLLVPDGIGVDLWEVARSAGFWRGAPDADIERLVRVAKVRPLMKGEILFPKGPCPVEVALVLEGHVARLSSVQDRLIVLETYWRGDVAGGIAALAHIPFVESYVEAPVAASVALIPAGLLKDMLAVQPMALSLISDMARRLTALTNDSRRNSMDVGSRVTVYLSGLPKTHLGGAMYSVEIPVSRVELAMLLGTTPESLSRAFRHLEREGRIESHGRLVVFSDEPHWPVERTTSPQQAAAVLEVTRGAQL